MENPVISFDNIIHGSTIITNFALILYLLRGHKIYLNLVRAVNDMYKDWCSSKGVPFHRVDGNNKGDE